MKFGGIGGNAIQEYLDRARQLGEKKWPEMKKRMKRLDIALKVVDPASKGNFAGYELGLLVFGQRNGQLDIDFQPLVDRVTTELEEMKESIIDKIVEDNTLR